MVGVQAGSVPSMYRPRSRAKACLRRGHAGGRHRGQTARRVHRAGDCRTGRRYPAGGRSRAGKGGGAAAADRKDRGRRRRRGGPCRGAEQSGAVRRQKASASSLCGGNIDTRLLANVLLRDLARSGRLARLRITLQDRPGALFKVMRAVRRTQRQYHRDLSPADFHHPAGQGPDHRYRMRSARPRNSSTAGRSRCEPKGYVVNPVELD